MEYTNEPKHIGKIMEDYKLILPDGTINHDKIISLFNIQQTPEGGDINQHRVQTL